jgi:hypothetical protein
MAKIGFDLMCGVKNRLVNYKEIQDDFSFSFYSLERGKEKKE